MELVLTRSNFDKRREALLAESSKNLEAATLEVNPPLPELKGS